MSRTLCHLLAGPSSELHELLHRLAMFVHILGQFATPDIPHAGLVAGVGVALASLKSLPLILAWLSPFPTVLLLSPSLALLLLVWLRCALHLLARDELVRVAIEVSTPRKPRNSRSPSLTSALQIYSLSYSAFA